MNASILSGWEKTKIKFVSRVVAGSTPDSGKLEYWDGEIVWLTPVDLGKNGSDAMEKSDRTITIAGVNAAGLEILPRGSIVISTRAPIGSVGLLAVEATTNQGCKTIIPDARKLDSKFAYYFALDAAEEFASLGSGTTFTELSSYSLKNFSVLLPDISTQRRIAAYLDEQTAKIDRLIDKRQQQIELLKEQRAALIQQAVTRGLNPNAPMKDSGIAWLGVVPEHWDIKSFKFLTARVDVGIAEAATHAYADSGIPIIRSTNVRPNRLETDEILFIEPWFAEKNRSKYLFAGDIVTTRTGNAGVSAVIPQELDRCQCFTMLISTLRKKQSPEYFCHQLNCSSGRTYFKITAWGTAQDNISVPILKDMPVVVPPFAEQIEILEFIRNVESSFNKLMKTYDKQIALLQEYRAALIQEWVTGEREGIANG